MTAIVLLGSVSCSSDDEGSGGGESGYFEITFRGVTKTYNLDVISQSGNGEFNFVTSAEIPDAVYVKFSGNIEKEDVYKNGELDFSNLLG